MSQGAPAGFERRIGCLQSKKENADWHNPVTQHNDNNKEAEETDPAK
jgi:hypothetical protein